MGLQGERNGTKESGKKEMKTTVKKERRGKKIDKGTWTGKRRGQWEKKKKKL